MLWKWNIAANYGFWPSFSIIIKDIKLTIVPKNYENKQYLGTHQSTTASPSLLLSEKVVNIKKYYKSFQSDYTYKCTVMDNSLSVYVKAHSTYT